MIAGNSSSAGRQNRSMGGKQDSKGANASGLQDQKAGAAGKKRMSAFGKQMAEKAIGKNYYGIKERQFKRFFNNALQQTGTTGEQLLVLLERRLDNVVYSLKLASTRRQARQMVVHCHVRVNDKIVKSPSYLVSVGDTISFGDATMKRDAFVKNAIEKRLSISGIKVPEWLELKKDKHAGVVLRLPERADVGVEIEEHLIVELYSK
jgi:small subunit ribosomal protein S4